MKGGRYFAAPADKKAPGKAPGADNSQDLVDLLAGQPAVQAVENDLGALFHGLGGGKGHVRRHDGVGGVQQGMVNGQGRLDFEHVNARAAQPAFVQCGGQSGGIHHRAAGGVEQQRAGLHAGDGFGADEAAGGVVQRAVQAEDVRLRQHLCQRQVGDKVGVGLVAVVAGGDHPAAEGVEQLRHPGADGAGAHQTHGLAPQLLAHKAVLGAAGAAAALHLRQVAQQRQRHAHRQLRHRIIGIAGGIAHRRAHLPGGLQIHVIHAGEGHIDELQVLAGADDLAGQGHIGQHQHIRVFRLFDQTGGIPGAGIGGEGVPCGSKARRILFQQTVRNAQRLQQNDVHNKKPSFLIRAQTTRGRV